MMKKLLSLLLIVSCVSAHSQVITTDDLINITSLSDKKLSSYMSKLNFAQTARNVEEGSVTNEFFYNNKKNPGDTIMRFVSGFGGEKLQAPSFRLLLTKNFTKCSGNSGEEVLLGEIQKPTACFVMIVPSKIPQPSFRRKI